jgi:hypothetical protein
LFEHDIFVSHQQFLDDMMLMGITIVHEAQSIKQVLSYFMDTSSTSINEGEYQVFFFNNYLAIQHNISIIIGFQRGSLMSKYLGAPLVENALHNSFWEDILSKMEKKLVNWSLCSLNLLGHLILLN